MTSSEPLPGRARPRGIMLVAAGVAAALTVLAVRVSLDGRASLQAGEAAVARGDRGEAIRHYLDAGRSYVPWGGSAAEAVARLDALAAAAETANDLPLARRALEAIRAALLGTRSFFTPQEGRLRDVDRRLAVIYASTEDPRVDPGATHQARVAWHAERLARPTGPKIPYVVIALLGLTAWLGGVVGFMRRGVDAGLRLRRRAAITAAVVFVMGVAMFLVGLRLA